MLETSILIPTKNAGQEFEQCLRGVYSQRGVGSFEVIIIDSGSMDATLDIAGRYPVRVEHIASKDFHHARTRNLLADLAKGDFLVFLSQDALPTNDTWLISLLDSFHDPSIGAAYGRQLPKPGATMERHHVFAALYGESRLVKRPGDGSKLGYKYYHFSSVNAAIRNKVWQTTRFPEDLKVFEDVGIAKRILESGWSIAYEPRAAVYHSHNLTGVDTFKRYFDIGVVYQRLGIWNKNAGQSVRREGWHAFRNTLTRTLTQDGLSGPGSLILANIGKYIAVQLGRHERHLPLIVKKKLSLHALFD
jgi:rhamnosyltransferase